jgi:hypothetical protein
MITNLLDVVLGYGSSEVMVYGSKSAHEWFTLFQASSFRTVYILGVFNIVYMSFMVPLYVGMLVVHRQSHFVSSGMALILSLLALAIYVSGNAAIPMWALSGKYFLATTESQRMVLLSAGEAILARGEDFTAGSFPGLITSGIAAITIAVIMLRGGKFSKVNAWCGVVGFTFLSLFTFVATFIPVWYMFAYFFFGSIGGILALVWFALTGIRMLKLARV